MPSEGAGGSNRGHQRVRSRSQVERGAWKRAHGSRSPQSLLSYSRADEDFARDLLVSLKTCGFEPYLDKLDIAPGEPWEERLERLIQGSDTVVYVVSPDSVRSDRCRWEIAKTEFST